MFTFSAPYSSARITLESGRSSCRRYAQHRRSAANFHRWNWQRLTTTGVEVMRPHRLPGSENGANRKPSFREDPFSASLNKGVTGRKVALL
jgi:hypothetical protein